MDKATIEIDCEAGTVTVHNNSIDLMVDALSSGEAAFMTTRSSLVAILLAMQSRDLMAMSKQDLMAKHLAMIRERV